MKRESPPGKICTKCRIWKPLISFSANLRVKDGKQSACRFCNSLVCSNRRIQSVSAWYEILQRHRTCQICGYAKCFAALDFHHRDPSIKKFGIGEWVRSQAYTEKNKKIFMEEIVKCDVLCANCHRELHWNENRKGKFGGRNENDRDRN